jgi:hypothetical protein
MLLIYVVYIKKKMEIESLKIYDKDKILKIAISHF